MKKNAVLVLVVALVASLFTVSAATAVVAGHKVTLTSADAGTGDVTVDVTGYMDATYTFGTLWLGFYTFGGSSVPAIDWGDSSVVNPYGYGGATGIPRVVTSTSIGGFNVHVYRGSFAHTYAGPGVYTITANSVPRPITHTPVTGNYAYTPTYFGTYSYRFLSNTTVANLIPPVIEIPTASEYGLLALGLGLGLAGILVLRRA